MAGPPAPAHSVVYDLENQRVNDYVFDNMRKEVTMKHPEDLNKLAAALGLRPQNERVDTTLVAYFTYRGWKYKASVPKKMTRSRIMKKRELGL